jgi:hypothetical protein
VSVGHGATPEARRAEVLRLLQAFWVGVALIWPLFSLSFTVEMLKGLAEAPGSAPGRFAVGALVVMGVGFVTALGLYAGVLLWRLDWRGPWLARIYVALHLAAIVLFPLLRYGMAFATEIWRRNILMILFDLAWLGWLIWSGRMRGAYATAG